MAPTRLFLSAVTALVFVHYGNAQTGEGCYSKTCPEAGQVRINAIFNNGNFIGGCNCGCDPELGDKTSPKYCSTAINFNPISLRGDCSCLGSGSTQANPPSAGPGSTQTNPAAPAAVVPIGPLVPGTPIEVICGETPTCECPYDHVGDCTLSCTGSPDACIEAILSCNNPGYRCNVDCSEQAACSGATIFGPVGGALEVYCTGEESCDTQTVFDNRRGTDLTVICDGIAACAESTFHFGSAINYVECNGDPDACQGSFWNLLPNARTTAGASFACVGLMCPEPPLIPAPFDNNPGRHRCSAGGDCSCELGLNEPCEINCEGTPDSCKDGLIECNSDGFDCIINCRSTNACGGATSIIGPRNAGLTVNCFGDKSCQGSVVVNGATSSDVTIRCHGFESCKGNSEFNFGYGVSSVSCTGNPDSCDGAMFNLVAGAQSMSGAAFECKGDFCPIDAPAAFSNVIETSYAPYAPPASGSTSYCCITSIPDFKPWAGRCWGETTPESCALVANNRCLWDISNCLAHPPTNSYPGMGACKFYDMPCTQSIDCCSETCTIDGRCQ